MLDLATIGIGFDTSGLQKGEQAMKAAEVQANRTADAADKVTGATGTMGDAWQRAVQRATAVTSSVERQNAAMLGASRAMQQNAAATKDSAFAADVLARRELEAAEAADRFIAALSKQVQVAGKNRAEILAMEAAMHGVTDAAAPMIAKLQAIEQAQHKLSLSNAGVVRELGVLAGEAMRGDMQSLGSSMTVLANRSGAMQMAVQALRNPLVITGALVAALAVGAGVMAMRFEDAASRTNGLQAQLEATGRMGQVTNAQLTEMQHQLMVTGSVSKESAAEIVSSFTRSREVGTDLMKRLTADVTDFAAATGRSAPEASKALAQAFENPADGARTLHKELGILSGAQVIAIEKMVALGDVGRAQTIMVEALEARIKGLHEQALGPIARSTNELGVAWDRLTHTVGNSAGWEIANTGVVKLVQGLTWIVEHADTLTNVLGALYTVAAPGSALVGLVAKRMGMGQGGAAGSKPGGLPPGGEPADPNAETTAAIDRTILLTKSYRTQRDQLNELHKTRQLILNDLAAETDLHGKDTARANELSAALHGINERIAQSGLNKGGIDAQIAALNGQIQRIEERAQGQVQHLQSLARQGVTTQLDALTQEREAMRDLLDWKEVALNKELELVRRKPNAYAEVAQKQAQLLELEVRRDVMEQQFEDKRNEHIANELKAIKLRGIAYEAAQEKEMVAAYDAVKAEEFRVQTMGMSQSQMARLTLAKLESAQADLYMVATSEKDVAGINARVDAQKKLIEAIRSGELKQLWLDDAAAAKEAWKDTGDSFVSTMIDAGSTFRDWLKRTFDRLVLNPILAPIGSAIGAGIGTLPTAANAAGTGLLGGIGSSALGASVMGGFSSFGSGVMSGLSAWGAEGSVMGLLGSGSLFGGGIANGLGLIAGSLGPILVAVAAIAAIAKSFKGETRTGANYTQDASGNFTQTYQASGGDPLADQVQQLVKGTRKTLDSIFQAAGVNASVVGAQAGYETSGKDRGGVFFGVKIRRADGSIVTAGEPGGGSQYDGTRYEGTSARSGDLSTIGTNLVSDSLQAVIQGLQAMQDELPQSIAKLVQGVKAESLSDSDAQAIVAKISAITDAVRGFTTLVDFTTFDNLKSLSFDTKAALIEAAGGVDVLTSQIGSFYQDFVSEAERKQQTLKNITNVLAKVGLEMPTGQTAQQARDAFAAVVNGLDLNVAAERAQYVALMSVEQAFAQLYDTTEDVQKAAKAAADAEREQQRALEQRKNDLQAFSDTLYMLPFAQLAGYADDVKVSLGELSGGMGNFNSRLTSFFKDFFNETERKFHTTALIMNMVNNAGGNLSFDDVANASREQYRREVERYMGKTDEASVKMLAALLAVEGLFNELHPAVDANAEALKIAKDHLSDYTNSLQEQGRALEETIHKHEGYLDALRKLKKDLTGPLAGLTAEGRYSAARGEFDRLNAMAPGSEERLKLLPDAIREFIDASKDYQGTSSAGYVSDRALAMASTEGSESAAVNMIDLEKSQLEILKEQLKYLKLLDQNDWQQIEAGISASKSVVDATMSIPSPIGQAVGSTVGTTVAGAVRAVGETVAAALRNMPGSGFATGAPDTVPTGSGAGPGTGYWQTAMGIVNVQQYANRAMAANDQVGAYHFFQSVGMTQANIASALGLDIGYVRGWFEQGAVPSFDVGTNRVPRDMTARIHKDEAIVPARFNPWAGGVNSSNSGEVADLLRSIERKLDRLNATSAYGSDKSIEKLDELVEAFEDAAAQQSLQARKPRGGR